MSTTARDLIQDALEMLGVYSAGETGDAADSDRMLFVLNALMDELAAENIFVNGQTPVSKLLTVAKANYSIGNSGTPDITAPRPLTIAYGQNAATVSSPGRGLGYAVNDTGIVNVGSANATYIVTSIVSGGAVSGYVLTNAGTAYTTNAAAATATAGPQPGVGTGFLLSITGSGGAITASTFVGSVIGDPVQVMSMIEYQSLLAYGPSPGQPTALYYTPSFPLGIVNLLPTPLTALTITFKAWIRIVSFPTLETGYDLAVGVLDALRENLAVAAKTYFRDAQIDPLILISAAASRAFLRYQSINSRAALNRFTLPTNPQKPN